MSSAFSQFRASNACTDQPWHFSFSPLYFKKDEIIFNQKKEKKKII